MSVRNDLRMIKKLRNKLHHLEYEKEVNGESEELNKKINDVHNQLMQYELIEKYVKVGSIIDQYAKVHEIEKSQIKVKSKVLHGHGVKNKNDLLREMSYAGLYHRVVVEISGGKKKMAFDFVVDTSQTLEDGSKVFKHIKVNKNGEVWIDNRGLVMMETNNVLANALKVLPYEKAADGSLIEESCGRVVYVNSCGKIFVQALLAEEKQAQQTRETNGEERE